MRLLKQICSIALSAGMVLSPVASVMAAEGVTQTAAEETIESVVSENEDAVEYASGYTGLANYGGNVWRYQVNGKIQWGYTGLVQYYGTWYYVEKGTLNWNYTGLTNYYGTWYYVENGRLNWGYTGLTNYYGTWYYVEKGVLNWNYTGLTNYYGTWYYVEKGVLNWKYSGLTNYYGTWYYVEGGILNWKYTGLAKYYDTWYYIEKGVLNWNYTGYTDYYGTRYYVEKGVLVWNYSPFNLQSISAATDKFAISPVIVWDISQRYRQYSIGRYPEKWDGVATTCTFSFGGGISNSLTLEVDLTTGIGTMWWDRVGHGRSCEGVIDFINRTDDGYGYFKNNISKVGYAWTDINITTQKELLEMLSSSYGKDSIAIRLREYGQLKNMEYLGNTGRGRLAFSLTEESGNPMGYLVVDPVYNYYAFYGMDCKLLMEAEIEVQIYEG